MAKRNNEHEDDDDNGYMDHGVPYLLRVLFDRFWDCEATFKPSKKRHKNSPAAFLFWLISNFEDFEAKELCHEAEVEMHVYEQLADMLESHSGQDIILLLWPVYTMAARETPEKRVKAITVSIGFCYDDATTSIVQSQTICERSDDDDTPLDDSSIMLALKSTLDGMLGNIADRGVDKLHSQNNISMAAAFFVYNLLGKSAMLFKEKMTKNLIFLQQFVAGVFAPTPSEDEDNAFSSLDYPDGTFEFSDGMQEHFTEDDINSLFDKE